MRVNQKTWNQTLALLKLATDTTNSSLGAVSQITVEGDGEYATLCGTDLDVYASFRIPATGKFPRTAFDLPSLTLLSKATKAPEIDFGEQRPNGEPWDRVVSMRIGKRSFQVEPGSVPLDERPRWPQSSSAQAVSWDAGEFRAAIDYVQPAICQDESRFHLCGVYFGDGMIAATDGHRIHVVRDFASFSDCNVIFRAGAAQLASQCVKACQPAWVLARSGESFVELSFEGATMHAVIVTRPIDEKFPPVESVIPSHSDRFVVDVDELRDSMKTALGVMRVKNDGKGVRLEPNSDLHVRTGAGFREVIKLEVPATKAASFHVDPQYLLDAIAGAGMVQFEYGKALEPVLVRVSDDKFAVVMPMRCE